MGDSNDSNLNTVPFPQNLTEKEQCPVHAFIIERAPPDEYYRYRLYESSAFWEREWRRHSAAQSLYDQLGDTERLDYHEMMKNWCSDKLFDAERKEHAEFMRKQNKQTAKEREREQLGPREFTLTYSPSWYSSDEDAQQAMRCAIDRLTRYYKHEIKEFHAIGEYTTAGCAHVHAYYLLEGGRKITDKNFKRAYPHWNPKKKLGKGHEGGHHASINRISDFAGYTEKHLEEAWMNIHINNADATDRTPPTGG